MSATLSVVVAFADEPPRVIIELFGEAGCQSCEAVRRETLPDVRATWGDAFKIWERDVFDKSNYLALATYRERFGISRDDKVSVVVDGQRYLGGLEEIRRGLMATVAERVATLSAATTNARRLAASPPNGSSASSFGAARSSWGWGLVLAAGLVDGINPCAIGTLVFFVSLLAAGKAGRWRMAAAGLAFCAGVFGAYVALGLGFMRAWRATNAFPAVQFWFRVFLTAALGALAAFSIRDAARYRRSGDANGVNIKLPRRLREASRRLARKGATAKWLTPACAAMGVGVTLIEAVCTGQTYLPALAFMSRQGNLRALAMLLAYNAMFTLPLAAILAAALLGWRSVEMAAWSKREVVAAKTIMAALFVVLALALWMPT